MLGGAVLGFNAEVERGEVWRGRGAGLGGERAPPTGHTGNGNEKTYIFLKNRFNNSATKS